MNIWANVYLFLREDDRRIDGRILMISKFGLCIPFTVKPIVLSFHSFHDLFDFLCLNVIVLFILLSKMKTKFLLSARFLDTLHTRGKTWHRLDVFPCLAHVTGSTVSRAWQNYSVWYAISLPKEKTTLQPLTNQEVVLTIFKQHKTCRNTSQHGGQGRTCCTQQCCDILHWQVSIVWPGL